MMPSSGSSSPEYSRRRSMSQYSFTVRQRRALSVDVQLRSRGPNTKNGKSLLLRAKVLDQPSSPPSIEVFHFFHGLVDTHLTVTRTSFEGMEH